MRWRGEGREEEWEEEEEGEGEKGEGVGRENGKEGRERQHVIPYSTQRSITN